MNRTADRAADLRAALDEVRDPEIRVLSIEELGILRSARLAPDGVPEVAITPTYVGCPAMEVIRADIRAAVLGAGFPGVRIETVWSPAWSTDWIGARARAKLAAAGIAPPVRGRSRGAGVAPDGRRLLPLSVGPAHTGQGQPGTDRADAGAPGADRADAGAASADDPLSAARAGADATDGDPATMAAPPCPWCGSADTEELTRFGSTACKALWRCRTCREPFDHFKEH